MTLRTTVRFDFTCNNKECNAKVEIVNDKPAPLPMGDGSIALLIKQYPLPEGWVTGQRMERDFFYYEAHFCPKCVELLKDWMIFKDEEDQKPDWSKKDGN